MGGAPVRWRRLLTAALHRVSCAGCVRFRGPEHFLWGDKTSTHKPGPADIGAARRELDRRAANSKR